MPHDEWKRANQRAKYGPVGYGTTQLQPPTYLSSTSSRHTPRFLVPKGVRCAVRSVYDDQWRTFTTTRDNGFERFERYERGEAGGFYQFRSDIGGWVMLVNRRHVVHREDTSRSRP